MTESDNEVVSRYDIAGSAHWSGTFPRVFARSRGHIELVKRFLRHSRISTTSDTYVHPIGLTNEATEAMANVFLAVEEAKGLQ